MLKAAREAGRHTSWQAPDLDYEAALTAFADGILDPSPENAFLPELAAFSRTMAWFGGFNGLSQCLLKIALPGLPDFYQGTELPQLALVDPDNRRPVAYDERSRLLETLRDEPVNPLPQIAELLKQRHDGRIKLFTIARALAVRRQHHDLFQSGSYLPLATAGRHRRHVVAAARVFAGQWCLVAVPRLLAGLVGEGQDPMGPSVWQDTVVTLPPHAPRTWHNPFTRQGLEGRADIPAGAIFKHYPAALLFGKVAP
jgi:(1->4)-alpha-D-glucan 1-alpha-D-glucosylmutase